MKEFHEGESSVPWPPPASQGEMRRFSELLPFLELAERAYLPCPPEDASQSWATQDEPLTQAGDSDSDDGPQPEAACAQ